MQQGFFVILRTVIHSTAQVGLRVIGATSGPDGQWPRWMSVAS
jgi:hypothetical protein